MTPSRKRGKVFIINQTVAASPGFGRSRRGGRVARAMNKYILATLAMIKAAPTRRWSLLPWRARVCVYIMMKTLTPLNPPRALFREPARGTQIVYNYR